MVISHLRLCFYGQIFFTLTNYVHKSIFLKLQSPIKTPNYCDSPCPQEDAVIEPLLERSKFFITSRIAYYTDIGQKLGGPELRRQYFQRTRHRTNPNEKPMCKSMFSQPRLYRIHNTRLRCQRQNTTYMHIEKKKI